MAIFKLNELNDTPTDEPKVEDAGIREEDNDDVEVKMVKLEGPLSTIYTEALNEAYSLESVLTGGMISTPDVVKTDRSYLYATKANDISLDDASEVIGRLKDSLADKYDRRIVILDDVKKVTPALQLVDEYSRDNGIEVRFNSNGKVPL